MTQPIILMGSQENALPIAKVAVISAVFGNTNENHPMEKIILPGPMADRCAKVAMKKKNIASLRAKLAERQAMSGTLKTHTPTTTERRNWQQFAGHWQPALHHP